MSGQLTPDEQRAWLEEVASATNRYYAALWAEKERLAEERLLLRQALRTTLDNLKALRDELPLKDTREAHKMILDIGAAARSVLELPASPGESGRS